MYVNICNYKTSARRTPKAMPNKSKKGPPLKCVLSLLGSKLGTGRGLRGLHGLRKEVLLCPGEAFLEDAFEGNLAGLSEVFSPFFVTQTLL